MGTSVQLHVPSAAGHAPSPQQAVPAAQQTPPQVAVSQAQTPPTGCGALQAPQVPPVQVWVPVPHRVEQGWVWPLVQAGHWPPTGQVPSPQQVEPAAQQTPPQVTVAHGHWPPTGQVPSAQQAVPEAQHAPPQVKVAQGQTPPTGWGALQAPQAPPVQVWVPLPHWVAHGRLCPSVHVGH
jgi:hypothetical protein